MEREIKPIGCQVDSVDTTDFTADLEGWFQKQPSVGGDGWFLAHADDGVVWGHIRNRQLVLSSATFPSISPPFRATTLQQARLFGGQAEVRVWRESGGFRACRLQDYNDEKAEAFDEEHILWGTKVEERNDDFSLVADGRQGLRHVVPLDLATASVPHKERYRLLRLRLRHYLAYNSDGQVHIAMSRLVALRYQS